MNGLARFLRAQWLCVALVIASTTILFFTGHAGNNALREWRWALHDRGTPLPFLCDWLARNYGMNEFDLFYTHMAFAWLFWIWLVAASFGEEAFYRQRFMNGFTLLWFLVLVFWSFIAGVAGLAYTFAIRAMPRPPAVVPTINKVALWGLPVLLLVLLVFRLRRSSRS
jgi:hypothetical protein